MILDIHKYMGDDVLLHDVENTDGTILSYAVNDKADRVVVVNQDKDNHNVCVIGNSGSGKTASFVKPLCLQAIKRKESVIITDHYNEMYESTSMYFRANGYIVRRIDLEKPKHSDGWSLAREIQGNADKISLLIQCILNNICGLDSDEVRACMEHLLNAVFMLDALPNIHCSLFRIRDLLLDENGEAYWDALFEQFDIHDKLYEARKEYIVYKQSATEVRQAAQKLLAKAMKEVSDDVCEVLMNNETDLETPAEVPCAYFYNLPPYKDFSAINAAFVAFLYYDLANSAYANKGGCKTPVNIVLDEFANIGHIPNIDALVATSCKKKIATMISIQSLGQMIQRYSDIYLAILGNCPIRVCLGCVDVDTAKYFSDYMGTSPVLVGKKKTVDRPVMTIDEIVRLAMDECIILLPKDAVIGRKFFYADHPNGKAII